MAEMKASKLVDDEGNVVVVFDPEAHELINFILEILSTGIATVDEIKGYLGI